MLPATHQLDDTFDLDIRDRENFWMFWIENYDFLHRQCLRWVKGNEVEAHEILSNAMMRALDYLSDSTGYIQNPKAWLVRLLRNHCIDRFRKQARYPVLSFDLDFMIQSLDPALYAESLSPERDMVDSEDYNRLKSVVEALPDRLKSVLILRAYQDMPYNEIAKCLDISPSNARKRVQEARERIRASLDANVDDPVFRHRQAHPSHSAPRSERRAVEDEMVRFSEPSFRTEPISQPIASNLDSHRWVELPIATFRRPIRINQKLKAAERYILRHPRGWTKRREKALLLAFQGKIYEAGSELDAVLKRQPYQIETLLQAARWMQWTERIPEAVHLLERGLAYAPKNAWIYILEGQLYSLQGQYQQSNRSFEQAYLKSPVPVCQLLKAENLMALQEWEKAASHLEKNSIRQGRLLYQACLAKIGSQRKRRKIIVHTRKSYPNDPFALALHLEIRLEEGLTHGEVGRMTRNMLHLLQKWVPNTTTCLFAKIAWHTFRNQRERGLEILLEGLRSVPLTLQHMILGEKWCSKLGAKDYAQRMRVLRQELFPDLQPWKEFLYYLPWSQLQ